MELEEIKIKLKEFLNESTKINTPEDIILKFKEIFENELFEEKKYYHGSDSKKLYIKNGCGLGLEINTYPGLFTPPNLMSNTGIDLHIFSTLADENITLFLKNEKVPINEDINCLYRFSFSTNELMAVNDTIVFDFLPENIKNTNEVVLGIYKNLKFKAGVMYDNDVGDPSVSYYAGLYEVPYGQSDYLYKLLLKYIDDTKFMEKIIPIFNKDYPNYISSNIDECEHALYIINHIEDYYKIADLSDSIEERKTAISCMEEIIYDDTEDKKNLQLKLDNALDEYKDLKNKKYSILELLSGKKKKDAIKLKNINNKINETKEELQKLDESIEDNTTSCKEYEREIEEFTKQKYLLVFKLDKPFKDFTLDSNETDLYIDGKYYMKTSLDRLKDTVQEYSEKLQQLQKMKSYNTNVIKLTNEKQDVLEYSFL